MAAREPLAVNEWYHCYNRGVDKRKVFLEKSDYERFLLLLHASNGKKRIHLSNFSQLSLDNIFLQADLQRGEPLVEIGAYCLMPNHVHLAPKEIRDDGISCFMQKVFTGYTGYFNKKYKRSGPLFSGVYKSKHLYDDRYLKHAIAYIHLNPVELFEPRWKEGKGNINAIEKYIRKYEYSSWPDFLKEQRLQGEVVGKEIFELFDRLPTTRQMLEDAHAYYRGLSGTWR